MKKRLRIAIPIRIGKKKSIATSSQARKMGDMNLSFSMIFSIILIVIFISFAFYAIQKFLGIQHAAQIGKFTADLQGDIDKIWRGSQGSQEQEYFLPSKIKQVCFANYNSTKRGENRDLYDELEQNFYGTENLFFNPTGSAEGFDSLNIKHIDIEQTTITENPLCFENLKGKISLAIKKDFGDASATISR